MGFFNSLNALAKSTKALAKQTSERLEAVIKRGEYEMKQADADLDRTFRERDDIFRQFQATHKTDWGLDKPGTPLQKAKRLRSSLMAELGNHLPEDVGTPERDKVIAEYTVVVEQIKTLQKRKPRVKNENLC